MAGVRLYGEMHRFIPIYANWKGAKITEVEVTHHPRKAGQSKYGLERIFKVVLDLLVVKFLDKYMQKPIYIFGGCGLFAMMLSFCFFGYMVYLKIFEHTPFIQTPLPTLTAMSFLFGAFSILLGLIAEILVRTYYESQKIPAYSVKEKFNF